MIIYFACSSLKGRYGRYGDALKKCKVSNLLASFAFKRVVLEAIEHLAEYFPLNRLIVDSGAFSAWSRGENIDLKEYADFCKEVEEKAKGKVANVYYVNLDVIPGEMGKNPSHEDIHVSAQKGWDNLEKMEEYGVKPLHIFHQFEDFKWLERLRKRQNYIGISPSNACSVSQRKEWLKKVFYSLKDDLPRTHGFGVTSRTLMEMFPWYSVDSTSWAAVDIYGRATFTSKKDQHDKRFNSRTKSHRDHVLVKEIKELQRLEKANTDLWAKRGIVWEGYG